ncbi:DUF4183 domain-containing protein [Bacillus mycoides]|uniref:DUF4183 domain-containing protein n=1 Tax=Bacillus mycoides TaxID=1405 RepID=UPI0021111C14|nr:DUF4183 domain-containing protein [Bacillus mycoides]MCQ6530839.1 DUF4183 domain-containing protein [Bacillus mycoides]
MKIKNTSFVYMQTKIVTLNFYINGVLQIDGIFTYKPGGTSVGNLVTSVSAGGAPILSGSPIVLEMGTFYFVAKGKELYIEFFSFFMYSTSSPFSVSRPLTALSERESPSPLGMR